MLVLYENIKKRRLELGMSQQELAEAVGYKGKSMISQIEKGSVDLSSSMINKIADALHCTASYLMGWEESEEINNLSRELVDTYAYRNMYNSLPDEEKQKVDEIQKQLVKLTPDHRNLILDLLKSLRLDA